MTRIAHWMAHPRMVFFALPWLMLLLVVGTLAQREIGLYEAERLYFASWVVWLGPLPLPGIYPTLAVLSSALIAKLILKSPWTSKTIGTITTHLGALLLLVGGLMTALSAEEGYLSAAEGTMSNVVSDYHARELVLLVDGKAVWRKDISHLNAGREIQNDLFGTMVIEKLYRNSLPDWKGDAQEMDEGIAEQLTLKQQPLEKQDEANLAGAVLRMNGKRYMLFEPMQKRPVMEVNGKSYTLALRKTERYLPFTVTIDDFEKQVHPGTERAREYQSLVTIDEGDGIRWQSVIRMNEPLRVQGYTLYQSSFIETENEVISVLAVVKNSGRVFPYIASLVIGIGMLMHLWTRRRA